MRCMADEQTPVPFGPVYDGPRDEAGMPEPHEALVALAARLDAEMVGMTARERLAHASGRRNAERPAAAEQEVAVATRHLRVVSDDDDETV